MFNQLHPWKKASSLICVSIFAWVLLAAAWLIVPVNANPIVVAVSPDNGLVGAVVLVSGADATPHGEVRVYLSVLFFSLFMETTTADEAGEYAVNVTVPALPSGSYAILVRDITTGDDAFASFTIRSNISVDAIKGSCNDEVAVQGQGFSSEAPVTLTFNGVDVTPTWPQPRTDGFGSFTTTIRIPCIPEGTYEIAASDGAYYAATKYTVIPKVMLSPTSGPLATTVLVNGTGFAPSASVSIEFSEHHPREHGKFNVTMYPTFPTDLNGSFMQLFFVPDVPDGEYIVNATDETGNSAAANFLVPAPLLVLDPTTATGNSLVTARGMGFPPKQPVILYLESQMLVNMVDLMIVSEALYANEDGVYEYSFIVPVGEPGIYNVVAYSLAGPGLTTGEELASAPITIGENALLVEIKDKIATIIIPNLGIIKENLTSIDAKLVAIEGSTVTIDSKLGLLQANVADILLNVSIIHGNIVSIETSLGTLEGQVTSIKGDTATIDTTIGTIVTQISEVERNQEALTIPSYAGLVFALIAGVGAIYLVIIHVQAMRRTRPK